MKANSTTLHYLVHYRLIFSGENPKSPEKQVHIITNLERLEQLADFAFKCKTPDEFVNVLK